MVGLEGLFQCLPQQQGMPQGHGATHWALLIVPPGWGSLPICHSPAIRSSNPVQHLWSIPSFSAEQVQILLGRAELPARKELLGALAAELQLTITSHIRIILWKIYKIRYSVTSLNILNLEHAVYWAEVTETTFRSGTRREKRAERVGQPWGAPEGNSTQQNCKDIQQGGREQEGKEQGRVSGKGKEHPK